MAVTPVSPCGRHFLDLLQKVVIHTHAMEGDTWASLKAGAEGPGPKLALLEGTRNAPRLTSQSPCCEAWQLQTWRS